MRLFRPEPELFEGLLLRAGNLDMAKVRAEIEQEKEAEMAMFSRRGLSDGKTIALADVVSSRRIVCH